MCHILKKRFGECQILAWCKTSIRCNALAIPIVKVKSFFFQEKTSHGRDGLINLGRGSLEQLPYPPPQKKKNLFTSNI